MNIPSTTLAPTPTTTDFLFSTFSPTVPFWSRRNLVALTTPFTYEADCLGRWLLPSAGNSRPPTIYSTSPTGTNTDPRWTSCQPFNYQTVYSPGVCPEGQTLASVNEAHFTESKARITEWLGFCCERGFTYDDREQLCTKHISTPVRVFVPVTRIGVSGVILRTDLTSTVRTTIQGFFPIVTNDMGTFTGDVPQDFNYYTTSSSTTTITTAEAWAEALWVLWQSSDLSSFPPAYATSLAKKIGVEFTPTPGATAKSLGPTSEPTSGSSTRLSSGARAGIGVGVGVFALLVISLAAFLILRRRGRNRKELPVDQPEFISRSS